MISKANFWGMFYAFIMALIALIFMFGCSTGKQAVYKPPFMLTYSNCLMPDTDTLHFSSMADAESYGDRRLKGDNLYNCPAIYKVYHESNLVLGGKNSAN